MTGDDLDVSVVLPVFNERGHLGREVERIRGALEASEYSFEIIVVDDGSTDGSDGALRDLDGIRLIHRKFQAVLEMAGVEEIPAEGQSFDPAMHEAVAQVPGDENKVMSVVQRGFKLGDRVIRPAMVVVGQGGGTGAQEDQ